jgi:hypothetical protein
MQIKQDGSWEIQKYIRTINDQGMRLEYQRLKDGEPVRTVKGRLIKIAK